MTKDELLLKLNLPTDTAASPSDTRKGWCDTEALAAFVAQKNPSLIIEVGSWYGLSAITMAQACPKATIICVDTWLGSLEHWLDYSELLLTDHGRPQVYWEFEGRITEAGVADRIIPLHMTSRTAAQFLAVKGIRADLIYLDGAHDYWSVIDDMEDYRPLLAPGGYLLGDDTDWESVRRAVEDNFGVAEDGADGVTMINDRMWCYKKK